MPKTYGLSRRSFVVLSAMFAGAAQLAVSAESSPTLPKGLFGLSRLVGRWKGQGQGEPGASTVERVYEPALEGQFLAVKNTSTYRPQTKNPQGEVHTDIGYFSFDRARKRAVFRQFHAEGFVNQYVSTLAPLEGDVIVFESEAIENIGAGWRARETYRFAGQDAFEEVFELAEPQKDFAIYSRTQLRRA